MSCKKPIFVLLRLSMGWLFLWGFLDKTFGLNFATTPEDAWLAGGSPTYGFLSYATKGPFAGMYQSIAGNPIVDWLFMLGLLGVGVAFLLGIMMKFSGYVGAFMMLLMYTAGFLPPEHNPFMDEHLVYPLIFLVIPMTNCGYSFSLSKWWTATKLVKKYPLLK